MSEIDSPWLRLAGASVLVGAVVVGWYRWPELSRKEYGAVPVTGRAEGVTTGEESLEIEVKTLKEQALQKQVQMEALRRANPEDPKIQELAEEIRILNDQAR